MEGPYLRVEDSGALHPLTSEVTTLGRGVGVDIALEDPTVSRLHAEVVARGPHVYVADLGLSTNGTRVNGRPVGRQVLSEGDVISLGMARVRVGGLNLHLLEQDTLELRRTVAPDLTRRELEVLNCLCRPALTQEAFVAPATAREIADELVVTEAAVKQHLLRLYAKFSIPEGINRRARLANEVVRAGVVRPVPGVPDLDAPANDAPRPSGNGGSSTRAPGTLLQSPAVPPSMTAHPSAATRPPATRSGTSPTSPVPGSR